MDELSEEDKTTVARARRLQRFLSQPFTVAEVFTGHPGKFVDLKSNIAGFKQLITGEYDHLPENAFYMIGGVADAVTKAKEMASRLDASVTKKGSQKRDIDFVNECAAALACPRAPPPPPPPLPCDSCGACHARVRVCA